MVEKQQQQQEQEQGLIQSLACVAGVKRGRGRGNLGARGERKGTPNPSPPLLPPPSRVASRPNSFPLPFRTPATQAIQPPSHNFQVDGSFLSELSCTLISLWVFNTRKHTTNSFRVIRFRFYSTVSSGWKVDIVYVLEFLIEKRVSDR